MLNRGLIIVTGGSGFVGRALCAHLRHRGRPVVGTAREVRPDLAPDLQPTGDLGEAGEAELDALVDGADAVIHLAGRAHVMRETRSDVDASYRRANAEATQRLARAAARTGVRRFVLASTVKVNGEATAPGRPFLPADAPDPQDAYARSKLAAEEALFDAARGSGMHPVVLRLPMVYGREAKGNFVRLVDAVLAGKRLPLASIDNRRSLLYVGNLVEAIEAAIDAPAAPEGVHFLADTESVSTPDLVRAIARAWKRRPRLVGMPVPLLRLAGRLTGRSAMIARLTESLEVDTASFRRATGWTPHWSLDAALARVASTHHDAPPY